VGDLTAHRDPAAEAAARVPAGWSPLVLEPSPPAVLDGDFFADDPTAPSRADGIHTVVPFDPRSFDDAETTSWVTLAGQDADLAGFGEARWLGPWRRLGPVPPGFAGARQDYHRLAFAVVAAARHAENGKFGLRFTAGGFGTPFFGADRQIRVVGNVLVDQLGDDVRSTVPATIAEAAAFLGVEPSTVAAEEDSPPLDDLQRPLALTAETGVFLGDWFGFAASVLEELRVGADQRSLPGRLQLWPGHFDPAIEFGDETRGQRATFGASPGDDSSPEPYLYIGPWAGTTDDPFWNADAFPGAVLPYDDLVASSDQRQRALRFFRRGSALLSGQSGSDA
jgi:hypothetical protein